MKNSVSRLTVSYSLVTRDASPVTINYSPLTTNGILLPITS